MPGNESVQSSFFCKPSPHALAVRHSRDSVAHLATIQLHTRLAATLRQRAIHRTVALGAVQVLRGTEWVLDQAEWCVQRGLDALQRRGHQV